MPAIAEIEFLLDATGAALLFVRHQPPDAGRDTARLIRPSESIFGLSFEQLAAVGAGRIIPDGKGGGCIEAASMGSRQSDQQRG